MDKANIPEKLEEFIREEAERAGYELVDIYSRGGRGVFLEVLLDKEGGITLDECGDFNRKVTSWIDAQKMFGGRYALDVCSPGLDRELKGDRDFSRAIGKQVKVKVHQPVDNRNTVIGTLLSAGGEEGIVLEKPDGNKVCIDKNNVAKARLWVSI